jgi:hypothetical protein
MASQTQGIQQLLAAEKRAAEKVSEARKRKLSPRNPNSQSNAMGVTVTVECSHELSFSTKTLFQAKPEG